jgi:hypothetical protein
MTAMKQYATIGCPSKPLFQEVVVQTSSGKPDDVVAGLASASPMSILGIVSRYLIDVSDMVLGIVSRYLIDVIDMVLGIVSRYPTFAS